MRLFPRNVAQCHGAGFRFVGPLIAASDNISFSAGAAIESHKKFQIHYMSAGEAGRHVVGFLYSFIDIFLEVQNIRYS